MHIMDEPSSAEGEIENKFDDENQGFKTINPTDGNRHPPPVLTESGWLIPKPIGNRLWQKSAIGMQIEEGIIVQPSELVFCHKHRSISLPDENWIPFELENNHDLLHEIKALNEIRKSGEILILMINTELEKKHDAEKETWAVRWNRGEHPNKYSAVSEMRWIKNNEAIEWKSLLSWVKNVREKDRFAEIMVIDEEFDVTAYRLDIAHPKGEFSEEKRDEIISKQISMIWKNKISSGTGNWVDIKSENWELNQIGVESEGGIWLNNIETDWIQWKLRNNKIDPITYLFDQLIEAGLLLRPGFKYGCKWRLYSKSIEKQHAPWLLVPESEAPRDWNAACLAARLSAGVNKKWICAINDNNRWDFISLERWAPGRD